MASAIWGNVYYRPGGTLYDPTGKVERNQTRAPNNFAWGDDDWKSLYITNIGSVVRTRLNIPGVPGH
jgi:hypothetical protein